MKALLISTAIAALILAVPTAFADDHNVKGGAGGHPPAHGGGHPPAAHAPAVHMGSMGGSAMGGMSHAHVGGTAAVVHGGNMSRHTHAATTHPSGLSHVSGGTHGNVDIHSLQHNVTAQHHFHVGGYRPPYGYAYHRWSYGESLPAIYFGRDYWIDDYYDYDLMEPPYGYVWVRYGPDALLIDEDTGEIVQVDYGVFY